MKYEELHTHIITKLEKELPKHITYHNVEHTKYVIKAVEKIAKSEGIVGKSLIELQTAALLHDVGFTIDHREHEKLSCDIAREILPEYHYRPDQIESICKMIMATKLPQTPKNHLSKILCDADLYYIGGKDYDKYGKRLFDEFMANGIVHSKDEWIVLQIDFLKSHKYFTKSARKTQNKQKKKKLAELQKQAKYLNNGLDAKNNIIIDSFLMIIGILVTAFALNAFLLPNQFFDGGISGVSLLVSQLFDIDLSIAIVALNLPLIILSFFTLGSRFAIRTIISIILLSVALWYMPEIIVTTDKLLIAVFGGIFLGIGIGLAMRGGTALDGIDVLALYTFKKTSFSMTEIIMAINIVIFSMAAIFFGIESAMYSVLTYFAASLSIDYVVEGLEAHIGVTIISSNSEEIKYKLVNELGRGITVYKGERGYLPGKFEVSSDCDIIFTVISRLEMRKLKSLIHRVDPNAFVFASSIKETVGGVLRKKAAY